MAKTIFLITMGIINTIIAENIIKKITVPFTTNTNEEVINWTYTSTDNKDTLLLIFHPVEEVLGIIEIIPKGSSEIISTSECPVKEEKLGSSLKPLISPITWASSKNNEIINGTTFWAQKNNIFCIKVPLTTPNTTLKIKVNGIQKNFSINKTTHFQPESYFIEGKIYNLNTGKETYGEIIIIDTKTGEENFYISDPQKGFRANLSPNKKYKAICKVFGYPILERDLPGTSSRCDFFLPHLKKGTKFILENIYFYPNTYAIKKESYESLNKLVNFLKEHSHIKIEIQGHTAGDTPVMWQPPSHRKKGPEWNFIGTSQELSLKRAEAVKQYLVKHGISPERLITKGYGASKKLIPDPINPEEKEKNMRVEIEIISTSYRNFAIR